MLVLLVALELVLLAFVLLPVLLFPVELVLLVWLFGLVPLLVLLVWLFGLVPLLVLFPLVAFVVLPEVLLVMFPVVLVALVVPLLALATFLSRTKLYRPLMTCLSAWEREPICWLRATRLLTSKRPCLHD